MPITAERHPDGLTVTLTGEVDHHGARAMMDALEDTIATQLPRRLTLDLSGITFMDSSGIALLLRTHRQVSGYGGTLKVTRIPIQPRRVLDAAGVGRIISLE